MIYNWYRIFNLTEFLATGLVARTLTLDLDGRGSETFEITRGNTTAVKYDDGFLPIEFLDTNPYAQGSYAVYLDGATQDVYFGFEVEA